MAAPTKPAAAAAARAAAEAAAKAAEEAATKAASDAAQAAAERAIAEAAAHRDGPTLKPAAREGDRVIGVDVHLVQGAPTPMPFKGKLDGELSPDVSYDDRPAAMDGSTVTNETPHVPPPSKTFDVPPKNKGVVFVPSRTVMINDRPAARGSDLVKSCSDPQDQPTSVIISDASVMIGD